MYIYIVYRVLAILFSQRLVARNLIAVYSRTIVSTQYCYKHSLDLYRSQRFNQSRLRWVKTGSPIS